MSQPVEGQERAQPDPDHRISRFSRTRAGPGKWRGGAGVRKTAVLREADSTVISYICDRERAVVWGIEGGLPSMPHGLSLDARGCGRKSGSARCSPTCRSGNGDIFSRPTAGGGGFGDPLERDPAAGARGRRRRLCLGRAGAQGLRRGDARSSTRRSASTPSTRPPPRPSARRSGASASAGSPPIRRKSRPTIAPARSTSSTWCVATPWCSTGTTARCCRYRPASSARCSTNAPPPIGPRSARRYSCIAARRFGRRLTIFAGRPAACR